MRTVLHEGERVLYTAKKHWIIYLAGLVAIFVALLFKSLMFVGIALLVVVYIYFERKFNIWIVTNKRFIDEWGIISLNSKDIPLDKVNNVLYRQDIWGRILGYGTVELQSAAEKGDVKASLVAKPKELVYWIQKAQKELAESEYMECPFCREKIRQGAILCRYCGKEQLSKGASDQPEETTKGVEGDKTIPLKEGINVRW